MKIEQIKEKFQIDVGAPMPTILSNEHNLFLIFYASDVETKDDRVVTVKFGRFAQFKFGNPNDESMNGHPLYELGLEPYAIQKVIGSSWIDELIKMNSVHPYHKEEHFLKYQHFIFFFHDTCFEIVAQGYAIEANSKSNMKDEIQRIGKLL
jgi:hypothetical protein